MNSIDTLGSGSTLVGDYEIIRVLGSGGFGNTYLAIDRNLNREVAIKEFFPRDIAFREDQTTVSIRSPKFKGNFKWGLERFVQEAKLLAKFRHPNIVRVFRTFEANQTSYIVLDFVRGPNVEAWLRRLSRQPTQQELDELVAPLTDALTLLHEADVLHRDIKPANICIREETGDPVLLDFGASKYSMSEMTGTTAAIVSRGYSPYEAYAADSKQQGAWTDIYALGATVYRALTNAPPPEATERRLNDTIVPLRSQRLPGLRPEFLKAVDWALNVQPRERPQSIAEWQPRLLAGSELAVHTWQARRLQGGSPYVGGEATGRGAKATERMSPTVVARPPRRRAAALALVMLLLLGGGALAMWQVHEQKQKQEETRRADEARRNSEAEARRLAEARRQADEDARRQAEASRAEANRAEANRAEANRAEANRKADEEAHRQAKRVEEERQAALKKEETERQERQETDRQNKRREQQQRDAAAARGPAAATETEERSERSERKPKRTVAKRSTPQGSVSHRSEQSSQPPTISGIR